MTMTKRNVPSRIRQVKRVKSRKLFQTGAKVTSPGSFVYIDVEREQERLAKEQQINIINEFTLSDDEENMLERNIDSTADRLRGSLLQTLTNIAAYDKASGQVEAVARDVIETEVEHDSSVQTIAQITAQLDVLCLLASRAENMPENIRQQFMMHAAQTLAADLPNRFGVGDKIQRHRQYMDNIIAVSKRMANSGEVQGPYVTGQPEPRRR